MNRFPSPTLHAYLKRRAAEDIFAGVVRITRHRTEVFTGAYGSATRAWNVPNSLETPFDTASITKLFTSVAALQLVDSGQLSLETTAVDYLGLEETSIHPDANLGHLLSHTSGIGDDADEEAGEDYAAIWQERASYLVRETIDFLPQFAHKPSNFNPGEGCRYCNVGFILAGLMIEKATGARFRDRIRSHVFDPAKMNDSGFFEMDVVTPGVAEGTDRVEGDVWRRNIYSYPPVGSPDGGAYTTAADLEAFLIATQDAALLSPSMTESFLIPVATHSVNETGERRYGYGLEFQYDRQDRLLYFEKEGYNAGVSAVLRHYPRHETTVVILCNDSRAAWEPRAFIDSLLPGGSTEPETS